MKRLTLAAFAALILAGGGASAQDWKGMGRLFGKVMDPDSKPVPGATVKLDCPSRGGGTTLTADKKGQWAYQGLAACNWNVDIKADGFETRSITVPMTSEQARMQPIDVKLDKKKGPPPELLEAIQKGDDAFKAEDWPAAQANYEKVSQMRPDLAAQLYPRLARVYAAQKNMDKAIEFLQKTIDTDPSNQEMKMIAASTAMEAGLTEKAMSFLATIDDTKLKNGDGYFDMAGTFLKKGDAANAVTYYSKAIAVDPKLAEAYYWRGIAYVQQTKIPEAKADMQKAAELDPTGSIGERAKKALAELK